MNATKSTVRNLPCRPELTELIINTVRESLVQRAFECKRLMTDEGAVVLEIEKRGRWRKLTGLSTGLTVEFLQAAGILQVVVREPQWGDKAVVAGIGTFVALWPLAVTASFGAYQQLKLPEWVLTCIEDAVCTLS